MDGGKNLTSLSTANAKRKLQKTNEDESFFEHRINMYKTLNSTGINKCFCYCKNHLQKSGEETDKQNGAIFSSPKWHFLVPGA